MRWSLLPGLLALALPCLAEDPPPEVDPAEPCEPIPVWLAHRRPAEAVVTYELHYRMSSERDGAISASSSSTTVLELTWVKELKKGGQRVACVIRRHAQEEKEPRADEPPTEPERSAAEALEGKTGELDLSGQGKLLERRGEAGGYFEELFFELPAGELEPGQTWTQEREVESSRGKAGRIKTTFTYEGVVARGERRLARVRIDKVMDMGLNQQEKGEGYEIESRTEYEGMPRLALIDVFDGTLVAITPQTIVTTTRMSFDGRSSQHTLASTSSIRRRPSQR